jgi:hypothetical protein
MGTTVFRIRIVLIFHRCGNPITPSRTCRALYTLTSDRAGAGLHGVELHDDNLISPAEFRMLAARIFSVGAGAPRCTTPAGGPASLASQRRGRSACAKAKAPPGGNGAFYWRSVEGG